MFFSILILGFCSCFFFLPFLLGKSSFNFSNSFFSDNNILDFSVCIFSYSSNFSKIKSTLDLDFLIFDIKLIKFIPMISFPLNISFDTFNGYLYLIHPLNQFSGTSFIKNRSKYSAIDLPVFIQ